MEREPESKSGLAVTAAAAAVLAAILRLLGAGAVSLTMNEAENTMTALRLFENGSSGQLLYVLPTAVIFKFFDSSEFTARLVPALCGVMLALVPLLIHEKIGYRKAVILSFLLAVDPVLLFWSKRADAVIPAIAFFALALALMVKEKYAGSLVCFLMALCGGERIWPAMAVLAVCAAIRVLGLKKDCAGLAGKRPGRRDWLTALCLFVLLCTAFGTFPGGLSGFGTGFVNSFRIGDSWLYPGLSAELIAVLLYCGIPLLICIFASVRGGKIPGLLISLAAAAGLMAWQGVIMLPWIVLLLWTEASEKISDLPVRLKGPLDFHFFMSAFVVCGAYSFFYFRMVELFNTANGKEPVQITWNGMVQTLPLTRFGGAALLTAVSILILALVVKILMGFVQSASIYRGIMCGILVISGCAYASFVWNAGGFDREGDHPLAVHPVNTANVLNGAYTGFTKSGFFDLLSQTIDKHGDKKNVNYGLNFVCGDAMVGWMLRNDPGIRTTANIHEDLTNADLIIDTSGASYEADGYVSTQQSWRGTMDWKKFSFSDWGKWLIFGDGRPVEEKPISLWVRSDYIFFHE